MTPSRPARPRLRPPGRVAVATAALLAAAGAVTALAGPAAGDDGAPLLQSGVVGSLPTDPALVHGTVNPGGKPWVVQPSTVRVTRDGRLVVRVRGLVIPDPPLNGTNPVPTLAASLVCGDAVVATTAAVPFSTAGDALIRATVAVPARCLAPAVLLNPLGNAAVYIGTSGA